MRLAEREPDEVTSQLAARIERRARHARDADRLHQPVCELSVVVEAERRDVAEDVVRAFGQPRREARDLEAAHEDVASRAVLRAELVVIRAPERETGGDRLLQRRRRADGDEVVHLTNAAAERRRRDDPSDAPTGDRERLARAGDRHRSLGHARQRRDRDVRALIPDVLVDLVGHRDGVVLDAERRDELELFPRKHPTRRVVRRVHNDRLRARRERGAQLVGIEDVLRRTERDVHRLRAGDVRIRAVVLVERLEHDDLVAGIDDREERADHRFGRAAGDGDHRLRIDAHAIEVAVGLRDRIAQRLRAPGDRVLVDVRVDRALRGLLERGRRGEIREALREVDAAM